MVPPRGLRQLPCPEHWYRSTKGPVQSTFARICASVTKQNLQVRPARQAAMAASAAGGGIGTGLVWVTVSFCSSGGRLVPGIGGSVSACFLYIAALCLCKMLPLHADCCLLHKPAVVIVEKSRAQWNPDIQKYGRPASLVQEKVMFAIVKIHVVSNSPRTGPTDIFLQLCCLKMGFSSLHEVLAGTARRLNKPRARHYKASMWHLAVWHL